MGKINYKCEYGVIHSTANCRCMNNHVTTYQIKCDVPEEHKDRQLNVSTSETDLAGESLYARLALTVDDFLGSVVNQTVKDALTEQLEETVKAWLVDHAKRL